MLDLMRRDHTVRTLHWGLCLGALIGVMAWWMASLAQAGPGAPTPLGHSLTHPDVIRELNRHLLLAVWVALAVPLIVPTVERCSRLDLTLPISARRLWLGRHLAVLLFGLSVLLTAAVVAAGGLWWQGEALTGLMDLLGAAPRLVGLLALAHAILQSPQPSLHRIPFSVPYVLGTIVVLGGGTLLLAQPELPFSFPVAALLVAAVLYARTYRALPAAFTLLPREAEGERSGPRDASVARAEASATLQRRTRGRLWLTATLLRFLTLWVGLVYLPLFVGFGALSSGYALSEDMRSFGAMGLAFMLWGWVLLAVSRGRLLDPLPLSRRRLFALVLAPAVLASAVGYGVTELIGRHSLDDEPLVGLRRHRSGYDVHVPARFHEIAWSGEAPATRAPWGESHPAWQAPLIRGLAPAIYTPFHAPEGSSLDFVALQLSRGIATVYGREIPFGEIRDRYLKLGARGSVVPRDSSFSLLEDYPGLAAKPPHGRSLMTLLLVGVPLLLSLAFVLRLFRAFVPGTDARRFNLALGPSFLVLALAYLGASIARISQPWIVSGFMDILGRQIVSAGGAFRLLAWSGTLAACVVAYRLARRQYERIQAPPYRDPKRDLVRQLGIGG